jgi:NAD(P)-dependent dehydrogenase (short-subunit alcohol dehydrogenase family)
MNQSKLPEFPRTLPAYMKKILITGTAGFIGFHLAKRLISDGWNVVSITL